MPNFNKTESANTPAYPQGATLLTQAHVKLYVDGLGDKIVDELNGEIVSLLQPVFREVNQKNDYETEVSKVSDTATAPLNEDTEPLPTVTLYEGWKQEWRVHAYRLAFYHTRHVSEIDNFGYIEQGYRALQNGAARTMKYAFADVFNRSIAPATGAQFLCRDGKFLFASGRPNPIRGVPNWSNLIATGDITEDWLFAERLAARNLRAHNGDQMSRTIVKIHLPSAYEKVTTKVLMTEKLVGSTTNDRNTANVWFNADQFVFHDDFTVNLAVVQLCDVGSEENGLQIRKAVPWGMDELKPESPDLMGRRIRSRWGLGCSDPRCWRGGLLNALS